MAITEFMFCGSAVSDVDALPREIVVKGND